MTPTQEIPCEFSKIVQNNFFHRALPAATSFDINPDA